MNDDRSASLEVLLSEAATAKPSERINWRDPIVVLKGSTTVGPGFYQLGQELRQVRPNEDDEAFGKRQQDETFTFWADHPEAGPLD